MVYYKIKLDLFFSDCEKHIYSGYIVVRNKVKQIKS